VRKNQARLTPLKFLIFVVALAALAFAGAQFTQRVRNTSSPNVQLSGFDRTILGAYVDLIANNDVQRPVSNDPTPKQFIVQAGESVDSIGRRLQEQGLIRDANLFRVFVRLNGLDKGINAGLFTLRANMNIEQIAQALQRGAAAEITLTIPEGKRLEEVAEIISKQIADSPQKAFDQNEFITLARRTNYDYPFLRDLPDGASLEGYLFPDTYRVPANPGALDVLLKMLDNYGAKVAPLMEQARTQGKNPRELLILASIVEREAVIAEERPTIASVYVNRLQIGMPLQADPTTQYAMGYDPQTKTWWRTLTVEDYKFEDNAGYNTYINAQLPPGPIASPGLSSIQATINPAQTNFKFFLACQGQSSHRFFETFEEQQANYGC
jgi:UPF0755 protein